MRTKESRFKKVSDLCIKWISSSYVVGDESRHINICSKITDVVFHRLPDLDYTGLIGDLKSIRDKYSKQ